MIFECPGADRIKKTIPENIVCPYCGSEVEIWSDETKAACSKCKKVVFRKEQQSCLDWCKYANECLGEQKYKEYMRKKKR